MAKSFLLLLSCLQFYVASKTRDIVPELKTVAEIINRNNKYSTSEKVDSAIINYKFTYQVNTDYSLIVSRETNIVRKGNEQPEYSLTYLMISLFDIGDRIPNDGEDGRTFRLHLLNGKYVQNTSDLNKKFSITQRKELVLSFSPVFSMDDIRKLNRSFKNIITYNRKLADRNYISALNSDQHR